MEKRNKKKMIFILAAVVFAASIAAYFGIDKNLFPESKNGIKNNFTNTKEGKDQYEAKIDDRAGVIIEVTPKDIGIKNKRNIFEVSLNTHSVELDFDFKNVITLKDNSENEYKAVEWTGGRGWHHLSGDIVFPEINADAKNVTLEIVGVGGINRSFQWELL